MLPQPSGNNVADRGAIVVGERACCRRGNVGQGYQFRSRLKICKGFISDSRNNLSRESGGQSTLIYDDEVPCTADRVKDKTVIEGGDRTKNDYLRADVFFSKFVGCPYRFQRDRAHFAQSAALPAGSPVGYG